MKAKISINTNKTTVKTRRIGLEINFSTYAQPKRRSVSKSPKNSFFSSIKLEYELNFYITQIIICLLFLNQIYSQTFLNLNPIGCMFKNARFAVCFVHGSSKVTLNDVILRSSANEN